MRKVVASFNWGVEGCTPDIHWLLEVGYKVGGEWLTIQRGIEWCSGPPRLPASHTLAPRQEPRDKLIGGATRKGQSR